VEIAEIFTMQVTPDTSIQNPMIHALLNIIYFTYWVGKDLNDAVLKNVVGD